MCIKIREIDYTKGTFLQEEVNSYSTLLMRTNVCVGGGGI